MYFNSDKLSPYINKMNYAVLETSEADGEIALTWHTRTSNVLGVFRAVDVNNVLYVQFDHTNNRAQLRKIESGSDTQLHSNFTISFTAGDIVSVTFSGSNIDIKKNGAAQSTGWTSSFQSTATKHGCGFAGNASDAIDLFTFTGGGGGGASGVPRFMANYRRRRAA
jgi:hypothetical protein